MRTPELVQEGQAALGRADWAGARECFEHALEQDLPSPEALDGLGRALHVQPEYARAIELSERAFAAHLRTGRRVEADTDLQYDVATLVVALLQSAARTALESELDPQAASTVAQELLFGGLSQHGTEALEGL